MATSCLPPPITVGRLRQRSRSLALLCSALPAEQQENAASLLSRRPLALLLAAASAAPPALAAGTAEAPLRADGELLQARSPRPSVAEVSRLPASRGPLPAAEQAVVAVFERLAPSVVNVVDITVAQAGLSRPGAQVDVPEGNGTGVVWDTEGHIVTNYHVLGSVLAAASQSRAGVAGRRIASVARVTLLGADGASHEYVADLVGADRGKDLAVLRIPAPAELLRPIPRGRSEGVRVGQSVLCIGNPFGFDHSLTSGVVSGLERSVQSAVGSLISGGIQTDGALIYLPRNRLRSADARAATINPGNSGGPLLDSSGLLIGLNTAIFSQTGSSVGVGFAIPVDTVLRVVPQLIESGVVTRPSLNISLAPESIAAQLRVKGGALVQAVEAGSAAQRAGLLATRRGLGGIVTGDVMVGIDADPVRSPAALSELLERRGVGQEVTLHVVRGVGGQGPEQLLDIRLSLESQAGSQS